MSVPRGHDDGGVALVVVLLQAGVVLDEEAHHVQVAVLRGKEDGRVAPPVLVVDLHVAVAHEFDHIVATLAKVQDEFSVSEWSLLFVTFPSGGEKQVVLDGAREAPVVGIDDDEATVGYLDKERRVLDGLGLHYDVVHVDLGDVTLLVLVVEDLQEHDKHQKSNPI